jgi:dephospho-CoA kinase
MLIGLTGGIGCGKTTVVKLFEELFRLNTYKTDEIVHQILNSDKEVIALLKERWGEDVYLFDGEADRRRIAECVFENKEELEWLESVLHPRVRAAWKNSVALKPNENHIVEIPLLFEKRLEKQFELIVCVSTSYELQIQRLKGRGISEAQAQARIRNQLPLSEKEQRADIIIVNNSNLDFTRQQIQVIGQQLGL